MTTLREAAQQAADLILTGDTVDRVKAIALLTALAQPESEPSCRVCGSPIGSLHMAAGNLKCGWPARVHVSDCEPKGTQNVRTPASDREALIALQRMCVATLRDIGRFTDDEGEMTNQLEQIANMLEADAQCTRCKVVADDNNEHIQRAYRAEAMLAQQVAAPRPAAYVPLTKAEIDALWDASPERGRSRYDLTQAIEQAVRGKT